LIGARRGDQTLAALTFDRRARINSLLRSRAEMSSAANFDPCSTRHGNQTSAASTFDQRAPIKSSWIKMCRQ